MPISAPVDLGHFTSTGAAGGAITTSAAVSAGDAILILASGTTLNSVISSVTDTAGDSGWQMAVLTNATPVLLMAAWQANTIGMSSSSTITVNLNQSTRCGINAYKVTGANTNTTNLRSTTGQPSTVTGTATSTTITTGTLPGGQLLVIGQFGTTGTSPGTFTPGGSWTAMAGTSTTGVMLPAYQIVSVNTALTWSPSWVTSTSFRVGIWIFTAPATGGGSMQMLTGIGG